MSLKKLVTHNTLDEELKEFQKKSYGGKPKTSQIISIHSIEQLQKMGYQKIIEFVSPLKSMGLKIGDFKDLILDFKSYLEKEYNNNQITKTLSESAVNKSNYKEKNIFLNTLIFSYKNEFISFLNSYSKLEDFPKFDIDPFIKLIDDANVNVGIKTVENKIESMKCDLNNDIISNLQPWDSFAESADYDSNDDISSDSLFQDSFLLNE